MSQYKCSDGLMSVMRGAAAAPSVGQMNEHEKQKTITNICFYIQIW